MKKTKKTIVLRRPIQPHLWIEGTLVFDNKNAMEIKVHNSSTKENLSFTEMRIGRWKSLLKNGIV